MKKKRQRASIGKIRESLSLASAFPWAAIWSRESILASVSVHFGRLLRAVDDATHEALFIMRPFIHNNNRIFNSSFSTQDWSKLYGNNWNGHPFNHEPLCWWREFKEVELTGLLYYFLSEEHVGKIAHRRIHSFIWTIQRSIFQDQYRHIPLPLESHNMTIHREVDAFGNRLDVLLEWEHPERTNERCALAIEAKFDAVLDNDLAKYRDFVNKCRGIHPENMLLIVLGPDKKRKSITNAINQMEGWQFVSWNDVLRYWEERLEECEDTDSDFSRFRASLWRKLFGGRNGHNNHTSRKSYFLVEKRKCGSVRYDSKTGSYSIVT